MQQRSSATRLTARQFPAGTAFYRNHNYHTVRDTEEKLDRKRMALVVEGVYAAVVELARN